MRYPLTFYVDKLKDGAGGRANGPVVRILKTLKHDEGLYQHELVHVRQWFFSLGLHTLLYGFSRSYRLAAEVVAYRKQLKYYSPQTHKRIVLFASYLIHKRYNLDIDMAEALKLLTDGKD